MESADDELDADLLEAYWEQGEDWRDFQAEVRRRREEGRSIRGVKLA